MAAGIASVSSHVAAGVAIRVANVASLHRPRNSIW